MQSTAAAAQWMPCGCHLLMRMRKHTWLQLIGCYLSSPDIAEIFCPSPAKKPYADAFIVPKFSTATRWKMCVLSKPAYLAALRVAAASTAEPAFIIIIIIILTPVLSSQGMKKLRYAIQKILLLLCSI